MEKELERFPLNNFKKRWEDDNEFGSKYREVATSKQSNSVEDYHLEEGLLFKDGKLCIPKGDNRLKLMREAHTSLVVGQFGVHKIVANLQRHVLTNYAE